MTLSNGVVITIPVGASSANSEPVPVRGDDAYKQDDEALSVTIGSTSGGNYEAVTTTGTVTNTVVDDSDVTTVTLSSATAGQDVVEGGSIVYTASVNNPVTGSPLTVTLSNGVVITIPVGASSANSEPVPVRGDDAYKQDDEALSVTIGSTSGGNYEAVTTTGTVTNTVVDDSDVTTVTLSSATAGQDVVEGGSIVYTASVNNPVTGSPLTVTLSNGVVITIPVGASSANSEPVPVRGDDAYKQDDEALSVTIGSTSGGNYEAVTTTGTVTNTVVDDSDVTTVTLSSATAGQDVVEGGSIVYTASVNNPVTGSPLTVTLSNGVVITIPVGASSANSEPVPVRGDDAYKQDDEALSVTIGSTSGGNYEAVTTTGTVTNTVVDDSDVTTVTLSSATAGQDVVEGGSIVYTASVNNPVTGSPLTVTLSNGVVITIPVGASSANSEPVPVRGDDAYKQDDEALSVTIGSTSGGNYEAVTTTGTVTNTVVDDSDVTTVTLSSATTRAGRGRGRQHRLHRQRQQPGDRQPADRDPLQRGGDHHSGGGQQRQQRAGSGARR
ncbi:immunoglobulin-like domain-containing protein [Aeromonas veronii]